MQEPTSKTLIPAKEESINFDESENIFIECENLEVTLPITRGMTRLFILISFQKLKMSI